ncbi:MAG TPA: ROK family transcriptional regulator [Jatrophihabitans sp.]|jgi:predicted NBD/HSP70 family sugar kinase
MQPSNPDPSDPLRSHNRQRILAALSQGRASSRGQLSELTGMARSTVTSLVAELLEQGLVLDSSASPAAATDGGSGASHRPGAGRPARRLSVAPRSDLVVAVDFGHSHCQVGVVDAQARIVSEHWAAMDVDSSAEQALVHAGAAALQLLDELGSHRERVVAAAIGLPAPVNPLTGTVGPGNVLPGWVNRHPADELAQRLGITVLIDNDANLGALAELRHGAARGCADAIYVKVSTGIGAGLVLGGRLHRGFTGRAGEIGHVPVDTSGSLCRCGNRGCLETVASVTQVLALMQPAHTQQLDMPRLAELVAAGDTGAHRVLGDTGRTMGRVLADMVNNLNPEVLVLGGELSVAGGPFSDGVRESLARFAQTGVVRDLRVCLGELGESAQLLGAAELAFDATRPVWANSALD